MPAWLPLLPPLPPPPPPPLLLLLLLLMPSLPLIPPMWDLTYATCSALGSRPKRMNSRSDLGTCMGALNTHQEQG